MSQSQRKIKLLYLPKEQGDRPHGKRGRHNILQTAALHSDRYYGTWKSDS